MSSDELQRSLGRIEGAVADIKKALPDHEKRLRTLERWRFILIGAFAVLAAIFKVGYGR